VKWHTFARFGTIQKSFLRILTDGISLRFHIDFVKINKQAGVNLKQKFKTTLSVLLASILLFMISVFPMAAQTATYKVVKGDTLWKIAVKYQVGVSEIIALNPQITNPALIYPDQVIKIPLPDAQQLAYEQKVVDLVNQARKSNGLKPLTINWQLARVARYKAQDMHDKHYFSHTSPTYGSPFDMMKAFGITYRSAGENIAMGYTTPQSVFDGWMNSPGHRANILNASYTQIGVGFFEEGYYWSQMFIG